MGQCIQVSVVGLQAGTGRLFVEAVTSDGLSRGELASGSLSETILEVIISALV